MGKTVYAAFTSEVIHEGHKNILEEAKKYGDVIVGVYSDEAILRFDRYPTVPFEERMNVFRSLPGISQVVVQKNVSYRENLLKYRPDYVIHGDNWKWNEQKVIREEVIQILKEWGGELIEVPYTVNDEEGGTGSEGPACHAGVSPPSAERSAEAAPHRARVGGTQWNYFSDL